MYDLNDSGQCCKTMNLGNVALARSVNYNCKVCCKLKRTFTIVNYDPKPYIVQATARSLKILPNVLNLFFFVIVVLIKIS